MSNNKENNKMSSHEPNYIEQIIIEYLINYMPAKAVDPNIIFMTTSDIVYELSDVIDLNISDIAKVMVKCGYHLLPGDNDKLAWAMKKREFN